MELLLVNNTVGTIYINDLGIELASNETSNLLDSFTAQDIIDSENLKTVVQGDPDIIFLFESEEQTYDEVITNLTNLTVYTHEKVDTFNHLISEGSFFKTQKVDGKTKLITYYVDENMDKIILEEEIVRGEDSRVSMIKKRHHDDDGEIIREEHQTFNRVDGRVDSVKMEIIK